MAEHGAWEVLDVPADDLAELPQRLGAEKRLVLLDSIWLTPREAPVFLDLRARGWDVGVVLHSFPSMIVAAESGRPPLKEPTTFELATLERLGLALVPGPHYARLLKGCRHVLCVEPGLDSAWRAPPRPRNGPCRLVSVGAVSARKGFLDLAQVLQGRQHKEPADFTWTVVGSLDVDRGYASRLVEHTRRLAQVTLAGQKSPDAVRQIVCSSDVLVMPSYDENQPLVLVEAMAASVPAVAYAAGAAQHMLEHDKEGLIAPIGDKRALATLLASLIDDEPRRYSLALACWDRQRSIPTWSEAASRARSALRTIGVAFED
jgi:glycosyltransferase involved in cell wall biosynthesis